ncbi:hypothetical protein AZE42_06289 [Rhizopogon vesiculosus]|uniref:YDG domain-containing protein n=1 Tax=Rhizopogon vesiculosus TaxID=180088 RepID=A0A1J8RAX0_9AGAM|nr:hypothetical protein AZE42_06289 [Rhizopogon vesiculosus]
MVRGVPDVEGTHYSSNEEMEEDPEEIARRRERKELSDRASKLSQRFGHIPGVKIGATWNTREQCSFAGVHRPFMAGIHGKKEAGAFSIVIAGNYEDDKDSGDTIIYTGAGGRQRWTDGSDGNPPRRLRVGPQIYDQSWDDWGNEALVTSRDTGNPVRVIRSFKGVSGYAPVEGLRYDGLYIVEHVTRGKKRTPRVLKSAAIGWRQKVPGQPPIPLRSAISVDTSDTASAATPISQFSPAQSPSNASPPPVAILTPLQRHKQRVMQEMQALEQLMGQSSSVRR